MKISFSSRKPGAGFALIILMASLVVILLAFASVMWWLASNSNQTKHNIAYTASEAAAEGATETVFAQMDRDYLYQSLNSVSVYTGLVPNTNGWPIQFIFSDTNGNTGHISINLFPQSTTLVPLGAEYANLQGYPQTNIITATATPVGQLYNTPATVSQMFIFASVPAFQFAIFYNVDLDMSPGAAMTINGATFCNDNIWCFPGGQMTFNGTVQAAENYFFAWDTNGDESGNISGSPLTPVFNDGTPISHANPLIIPIGAGSPTNNSPTNVEGIIEIPPPGACAPQQIAYAQTNQVYDFNAASLIVSNWSRGTSRTSPTNNNFTVWLQDSVVTPSALPSHWIQLTNDYYQFTNHFGSNFKVLQTNYVPNFQFTNMSVIRWTNTTAGKYDTGTNQVFYASFSFLTNVAFTDYRESATAQAVQIDVSALRAWITNSAPNGGSNWNQGLCQDLGHGINSVFVYNDVPFVGQTTLPAVCLVNGQRLPNSTNVVSGTNAVTFGLTVVTPQPLYVIGNYNVQIDGGNPVMGTNNTSSTYPAGFYADAVTILSSNWLSDWTQSSYSSRSAVNTTVNAARLEGIVLSTGGQTDGGDGSSAHYSGGIENFLRMLENWGNGSVTLTYNGSIMVMFPSQYATNYWQLPGNYYDKPTRNWGFDTNFLVQSRLPPLTPQFRTVVRNQWSGY